MTTPQRSPSGMPRACRSTVELDGVKVRCTYPQLRMPRGGQSTMCYWHRLMRTSMDAQIREAVRRKAAAAMTGEPERVRVPAAEWPDGERWCAGCQSFVPLFYARSSRCLACAAQGARESRRMTVYGLSQSGFERLAKLQDDRCAICRKRQRDRSIAVDHNHTTGDVRGLLCKRCNHDLLGSAFESVRMLLAAAIYLTVPPTSGDWIDPEEYGEIVMRAFLAAVDEASRAATAERRAPEIERAASAGAGRAMSAGRSGSRGGAGRPLRRRPDASTT